MDDEILLRFLAIGVIDVGGDDTKLEKLRATVADLSSALKAAPSKASSYTMVAADPAVDATDPTIQEAMSALKKNWTTVANTFSATPITVIRAMLLDAVVQCSRQDDSIAVAFVNSARNTLPHLESGNEQPIWEDAVAEIEVKVDARAEAEWATPEMISINPLSYKSPSEIAVTAKKWSADRETLTTAIQGATSPTVGSWPNQYFPHNYPEQWAAEFASRLSTILGNTIEEAVTEARIEPIDLGTPLTTLAKAVSTHVENALAAFSGATAGLQRRTNLLWWKEALYSTSARASYRDLPIFSAAALMALDLIEQVPTYSPASVAAFLSEAILQLPAVAKTENETVLALVADALKSTAMAPLRDAAAQLVPAAEGRGPLLSVIGHTKEAASLDAATLRRLCGVGAEVVFSPPAWGAWLYRELQAARATGESNTKRSRRNKG